MITDYDIFTAEDPVSLAEDVRVARDSGWEPHGGVAITTIGTGVDAVVIYAQALIRKATS